MDLIPPALLESAATSDVTSPSVQTPISWLAIAALVIGGLVRLLKKDMLGDKLSAVLTWLVRLFRPERPPVVIPTRALPWIALGLGAVAAVLDAKLAGADWNAAAQVGVLAAASAVFGHELLSGVPWIKDKLGIVLVIIPLSLASTACREAKTPREQARSVVLTIAEGVRQGDETCAAIANARQDLELALTCAAIVFEAREQLLTAEDGVDTWDAAATNNVPCLVRSAASSLTRLLEAVNRAGGKVPAAVEDALRLAPILTGGCRV